MARVVLCLLIAWGVIWAKGFLVEFSSPGFRYQAGTATLWGEPFTGVSYQWHSPFRFYKIQVFSRGKQQGTEHRWYARGTKWQEVEYQDGKRHGQYRVWYEDGSIQGLKHYRDDLPHGESWGWHANGVVSDYQVYENGKERVFKSFISDGKPYYNFVVRNEARVGVQGGDFCKRPKARSL